MAIPVINVTDTITIFKEKTNEIAQLVGNLDALTTTADSSLVTAINELDGLIGELSTLSTTAKSTIVAAINEVDSDVATFQAQIDANVASILSIDSDLGVIVLSTTAQTAFAAINELEGEINDLQQEFVDQALINSALSTEISNADSDITSLTSAVGSLSNLDSNIAASTSIVSAINELQGEIILLDSDVSFLGDPNSLTTTAKNTFVAAINEINARSILVYDATGTLLN